MTFHLENLVLVQAFVTVPDTVDFQAIVQAGTAYGANRLLREELVRQFDGKVYFPSLRFCTDNGAMIAAAGALRLAEAEAPTQIRATARWSLEAVEPPGAED